MNKIDSPLKDLDIPLERDLFLRTLIIELADVLEDVMCDDEAAGCISLVGQNVGKWLNNLYKEKLGLELLSPEQVKDVFIDLKQRIKGDFYLLEQDEGKIVLASRSCPFEEKVINHPCMCLMTSNVFGVIAAENLGYAKVHLEETIAEKDKECKVTVFLTNTPESDNAIGREYYAQSENNAE